MSSCCCLLLVAVLQGQICTIDGEKRRTGRGWVYMSLVWSTDAALKNAHNSINRFETCPVAAAANVLNSLMVRKGDSPSGPGSIPGWGLGTCAYRHICVCECE